MLTQLLLDNVENADMVVVATRIVLTLPPLNAVMLDRPKYGTALDFGLK